MTGVTFIGDTVMDIKRMSYILYLTVKIKLQFSGITYVAPVA